MTVAPAETVAAHLAMFESSWFGQGPAFWRWVVTAEAEPYVAAFIERPRMPQPGERLYLMSEVDESKASSTPPTSTSSPTISRLGTTRPTRQVERKPRAAPR